MEPRLVECKEPETQAVYNALAAAKERHERATRPNTTGVVLRPIETAEYTIKDREERVADNKAAAVARRPRRVYWARARAARTQLHRHR